MSEDDKIAVTIKKMVDAAMDGYIEGKLARLVGDRRQEHLDSEDCWCVPRMTYQDPDTGACVFVHNEPEDGN